MKNTEKKTGMNLKEQFEQETGKRKPYNAIMELEWHREYAKWLEAKVSQSPEVQYQAAWILDDIEFGYDLEMITNKIRNNCYLNTVTPPAS